MKYIVMECNLGYAVVLDREGRFLKVANMHYEVGQTVTEVIEMQAPLPESASAKKKINKWMYTLAAAAACLIIAFTSNGVRSFERYGWGDDREGGGRGKRSTVGNSESNKNEKSPTGKPSTGVAYGDSGYDDGDIDDNESDDDDQNDDDDDQNDDDDDQNDDDDDQNDDDDDQNDDDDDQNDDDDDQNDDDDDQNDDDDDQNDDDDDQNDDDDNDGLNDSDDGMTSYEYSQSNYGEQDVDNRITDSDDKDIYDNSQSEYELNEDD